MFLTKEFPGDSHLAFKLAVKDITIRQRMC